MLINATRDASRFKKLQKLASNGTGQISENFDDNDDAPYTPREIAHMTDILFPQVREYLLDRHVTAVSNNL
ncbi:unnamed protein product [Onchocerca flexuosa]|uniref:Phage portal protein n=1 Tax=Onchocerca flexuosa TaxID=387005 RepID=A0A183HI74_9BILA|nr:unnamed protein product [Onchocerca flexuosa]